VCLLAVSISSQPVHRFSSENSDTLVFGKAKQRRWQPLLQACSKTESRITSRSGSSRFPLLLRLSRFTLPCIRKRKPFTERSLLQVNRRQQGARSSLLGRGGQREKSGRPGWPSSSQLRRIQSRLLLDLSSFPQARAFPVGESPNITLWRGFVCF
jgi:hypothetical protein